MLSDVLYRGTHTYNNTINGITVSISLARQEWLCFLEQFPFPVKFNFCIPIPYIG